MYKSESVSEKHTIRWDSKTQTDLLIPSRRPDLMLIDKKKRSCNLVGFAVPAELKVKIKGSEKTTALLKSAGILRRIVCNIMRDSG